VHADVLSKLNRLIDEKQKDYLEKMMGRELYLAFETGLSTDPVPDRFIAIRDGASYTGLDGLPYQWIGLKNAEKISPLADYIYYWWLRSAQVQTTPMGQVKTKNQNAAASPAVIQEAAVWNEMIERNRKLNDFLYINYELYPEYQRYMGSRESDELLTRISPFFY